MISIGNSSTFFLLSFGTIIVLIPLLKAARAFSLNPPIARALPRSVTSPVSAISALNFLPVKQEIIANVIATPIFERVYKINFISWF